MKLNPRMKLELAEFLGCKPEEITSYTPEPKLLRHQCGTCAHFYNRAGICAPPMLPELPVEPDTHSCGHYEPTKKLHP